MKIFKDRGKVQRLLGEYLKWRGFPEVWLMKSREKITSLLETIFYRDVIERSRIENIEIFKQVFYFILLNYLNLLSYRSLNRMLKLINIDIDVKILIKICKLHEASLPNIHHRHTLILTKSESSKPKENIRNRCINPKFIPSKTRYGKKMENLVFIEPLRRKTPATNISYYKLKTNQEIDFIISQMNKIKQIIEVTYNLEKH